MARVAFFLPGDGVWTGGVNYVETSCRALLNHPDLGYEPIVFCSPTAAASLQSRFESLLGARLVRDPWLARGRRAGLLSAVAFGRNRPILALCERSRCDVIFEAADFFGWRFPVACLAWVPDFQDRHLPQLFSRGGRLRKAIGLRLQLASGRTVLVSSEDARRDCERFYSGAIGKTMVARFAVWPALEPGEQDPAIVLAHGLPERFFYLPNQFWAHKNHEGVVDALAVLRDRKVDIVVAASGNPRDPRHENHYRRLREKVASLRLDSHFRFLGEIPARHVALLMRASVAMLNPSLFEGWSTTVEEAKSLGVSMVLSNLTVHREQVGGDAEFFDPRDVAAIAASLEKVWVADRKAASYEEQAAAAEGARERIRQFAVQLTRACDEAIRRARGSAPHAE